MNNKHIKIKLFYTVASEECKKLAKNSIKSYGSSPEHNYEHFLTEKSDESSKEAIPVIPVFAYFGNNKSIFALKWKDNDWDMISTPLCPGSEQAELIVEFCKKIFKDENSRSVFLEIPASLRNETIKIFNKTKASLEKIMEIGEIKDHWYTPIISLIQWDPELKSSEFSKLRKAKNRFFRNYKVEVIKNEEVKTIPFSEFEELINDWKKFRKNYDEVEDASYINTIKNKFNYCDCFIALRLDGKLCGLSAAWAVPNTNKKTIYYGLNIHNYSVPELGEFMTVIFLSELKEKGYELLDFGSSDKGLLEYKKKFKPISISEVVCFYITDRKAVGEVNERNK